MNRIVQAVMRRVLGHEGERAAASFLRKKRMKILVRNYCAISGEIDLIARDGDVLVFVEVKTRRKGSPAEAVTPQKQRKIVRAALHFLRRYQALEVRSRFDVVAIVWPEGETVPAIEHEVDAFQPTGFGQMFR